MSASASAPANSDLEITTTEAVRENNLAEERNRSLLHNVTSQRQSPPPPYTPSTNVCNQQLPEDQNLLFSRPNLCPGYFEDRVTNVRANNNHVQHPAHVFLQRGDTYAYNQGPPQLANPPFSTPHWPAGGGYAGPRANQPALMPGRTIVFVERIRGQPRDLPSGVEARNNRAPARIVVRLIIFCFFIGVVIAVVCAVVLPNKDET